MSIPSRSFVQPSLARAGWSLGLSLVSCCGIGNLVSLVLAIGVLRESRRTGHDHGKALVIAALVTNAVSAGVIAGVLYLIYVLGPGVEEESAREAGWTANANPGTVEDLDVLENGDCVVVPAMSGHPEEWERRVDCSEPHDLEVTGGYPLVGETYPGAAAVERAGKRCDGEPFSSYVGIPTGRSDLYSAALPLTQEHWEEGRRRVICVVLDPRGSWSGSLRGSER